MSPSPARQELSRLIEHTLRRADAARADVERLCREARAQGFASVCVNGSRVAQAAHLLEDTEIKVTCAVAFPLGASDADAKRFETEAGVDSGAHFIEVSGNLGRLKDGDDAGLLREFRDVVEAADERPVSILLDTSLLSPDEVQRACRLATEAAAKGVTLAGGSDATTLVQLIQSLRQNAAEDFGVKVDQHAFSMSEIISLLEAGATRFGCVQSVELFENLSR